VGRMANAVREQTLKRAEFWLFLAWVRFFNQPLRLGLLWPVWRVACFDQL